MAYRTSRRRSTSRARAPARRNARSRFSARPVRSTRRRSTGRSSSGGGRTIRIEVVTVPDGGVARPAAIGMKAAPAKRRAAF